MGTVTPGMFYGPISGVNHTGKNRFYYYAQAFFVSACKQATSVDIKLVFL